MPAGAANPYLVSDCVTGLELRHPRASSMFDYLLGGNENWAIDRKAASQATRLCPELADLLRQNRRFRVHAIDYCVARGVRRFIDLGCGQPMHPMTHELIDGYTPIGRCAYVDADPIAAMHTRFEVQEHGDPDRHTVLNADLRAAAHVLAATHNAGVTKTGEPVGLLVTNVAHFLTDAHQVLSDYIRLLPPSSYVVMSHLANHGMNAVTAAAFRAVFGDMATGLLTFRTKKSLGQMLGGLDLIGPGIVSPTRWCSHCRSRNPGVRSSVRWLTAIARKPTSVIPSDTQVPTTGTEQAS